jgi:hypothetical protein
MNLTHHAASTHKCHLENWLCSNARTSDNDGAFTPISREDRPGRTEQLLGRETFLSEAFYSAWASQVFSTGDLGSFMVLAQRQG